MWGSAGLKRPDFPRGYTLHMLKAPIVLDKLQRFAFIGHKIRAAMPGDDDCGCGITKSGGFIPIPAFDVAIKKATGERVSGAQCVVYLHRETRGVDNLAILNEY